MNHPHEQQAAAMARAGELPDGEQLRSGGRCDNCKCTDWCAEHGCWTLNECINSGQVSAAQVVAHAENGEVTTGWPAGMLQDDSRQLSKALSRDPNARALVRDGIPLVERLKQEAQMHAQEASAANATIAEIYQLCTGATGEPGNWHGAEPVRAALAAERAEVARLREALKELRLVVPYFWDDDSSHIEELDAACEKADEALK